MNIRITRKQIGEALEKLSLKPDDEKRVTEGLDYGDLAGNLIARLESYADEWLQEKVDRFLKEE